MPRFLGVAKAFSSDEQIQALEVWYGYLDNSCSNLYFPFSSVPFVVTSTIRRMSMEIISVSFSLFGSALLFVRIGRRCKCSTPCAHVALGDLQRRGTCAGEQGGCAMQFSAYKSSSLAVLDIIPSEISDSDCFVCFCFCFCCCCCSCFCYFFL